MATLAFSFDSCAILENSIYYVEFLVPETVAQMFCKKGVLRNFAEFTGKHLCQSLFFNSFFKKRLWHRCFTVSYANFLRVPFLQNTSSGYFCGSSWSLPSL